MRWVLFVLLLLPAPASGQAIQSYGAPAGPIHWVSDNPFRLYLIREGDTIGDAVRGISVVEDRWAEVAGGFQIHRISTDVGLSTRPTQHDSLRVTDRGEVVLYNGATDRNVGEWDTMLRLPSTGLEIGSLWVDTLAHATDGPAGEGRFSVVREYRATRTVDTLGVSGIEVVATGTMGFRLSMWIDSVSGQYRWFDLQGPVSERYIFDAAERQLVFRDWSMHLNGHGGDYDGVQGDTVQAGLRSANTRFRISSAKAQFLVAPMPGRDSTVTFREGGSPIFMHTFGRSEADVVEGFRRGDGLVGHARVGLAAGVPATWLFEWQDIAEVNRTFDLKAAPLGVVTDAGDITKAPTPAWGVAEYGMAGTLIPSLELLPVGAQAVPFSVYRPTPGTWTEHAVSSRMFGDFRIFALTSEEGERTVLIVSADGTLLYDETSTTEVTRVRVPLSPGSRMQELETAMGLIRGG